MATNPIFQIKQTNESSEETVYDLGTLFSNVRLDDHPGYSLKDFYEKFMSEAQFIYTGDKEPTSSNIKVWYETTDFNTLD